ncbi:MAG: DUF21 domain-containing protein, partial [Eubacterium sp.]|nr:DUF21 domain-containing protein [Eubacterium sp.]
MNGSNLISWIIVLILVACAAFLAVTETAFASVSRFKLKSASDRGETKAGKALFVVDHFDRAITTILVCTNIIHIAAASIVTVVVTRTWGLSAVTVSTILFTIIIFFAGEMLPKSIAKKYPEVFAKSNAGVLCVLMKILTPVTWLLTKFGEAASKLTKGEEELSVTEEEIYDIIEDMKEEGSINEDQKKLISSALQFKDVTLESVLTPRVDVIALNVDDTPEKMLDIIWLSAIFLVSCLPVITIGASLSALYYTVHKNIMDSRSYPSKEFFRSFASCFKQSTLGFLIVGGLGGLVSWECYMMYQYALAGDKAGRMGIPLLIVLAIIVMWATQMFPYISRYETSFKEV